MTPHAARGTAGAEVEAQAKVNLRLRILAREASGYHQLETLFLRLALSDTVRIRRTAGRSLDVSGLAPGSSLGPVEQNLAWRAAAAYAAASEWRGGFAIELEKRIPVGGGLGGGSADAGAVLRVMEAMADVPLGDTGLLGLAAALGADVPFLASEHPYVLAWGRGERMLALPAPEPRAVVLAVPSFGVNTAEAYGWLAAARSARAVGPAPEPPLDAASLSEWETIAAIAVNDFEPVVSERHRLVGQLTDDLRETGCPVAMLSGSGSVVFGVLPPGTTSLTLARDGDDSSPPRYGQIVTATADRVEPVRRLD